MVDGNKVMAETIRESAMLVDFTASQWSASSNDRRAERLTREAAGATRSIGRVQKSLLAGHDTEYKALCSAISNARTYHYKTTLPWTTDDRMKRGARLLPNAHVMDYMKQMNEYKMAMERLLEDFLKVYEGRIEQAKAELGSLANDADYPKPDDIRSLFDIRFKFAPVPLGSDFRGLPPTLLESLGARIDSQINKLTEQATKEACDRLRKQLDHLVERLSDKENRFHKTLVENAVETAKLLKGFNITKNPKIEKIRADFEQAVIGVTADTLRNDNAVRQSLADEAARLVGEMDKHGL